VEKIAASFQLPAENWRIGTMKLEAGNWKLEAGN
jgi:hypothetical protein